MHKRQPLWAKTGAAHVAKLPSAAVGTGWIGAQRVARVTCASTVLVAHPVGRLHEAVGQAIHQRFDFHCRFPRRPWPDSCSQRPSPDWPALVLWVTPVDALRKASRTPISRRTPDRVYSSVLHSMGWLPPKFKRWLPYTPISDGDGKCWLDVGDERQLGAVHRVEVANRHPQSSQPPRRSALPMSGVAQRMAHSQAQRLKFVALRWAAQVLGTRFGSSGDSQCPAVNAWASGLSRAR